MAFRVFGVSNSLRLLTPASTVREAQQRVMAAALALR